MKTRHFLAVAALLGALAALPGQAAAHSGHDHGPAEPPPPPPAAAGPGAAASGDVFELVLKPDAAAGTLVYLADLDSNDPVAGATIEAEPGGRATATDSPGIYVLPWSFPEQPTDLMVTVSADGRDDLLLLSGVARPAPAAAPAVAAGPIEDFRRWLAGGAAGVAALLGFGLIARRRAGFGVAALLLSMAAAGSAFAHSGHDHGPAPAAPAPAAPGQRVAMAKESQFLLGVRTAKAESREVADSLRLVGRVVPDPSGFARVQPTQPGRIVADPNFPLPIPGQAVKAGDVLAVLEPNLTALERAEQRALLYEIETQIVQTERQLRRWEQMGEAARKKDVDDARLDLERLRKQRAQVADTALGRDLLRAPIDGRVTDLHVVPGEAVDSATTVVEIVDPGRLRVEAVLHDLPMADRIQAGSATSKLLRDHAFGLKLIGSGGRIDPADQGLHLIFAVTDGAEWLKLGMPVDVHAETGSARLRVAVPREAVAEAGGRPVVFVKAGPESFEARAVKLGRTLGDWVEVESGVAAGERIVIQGAEQLLAAR